MLVVSILLTALVPTMALGSASGRLMVYSALPAPQLDLMVAMFNEKYPGITVDAFSANSADNIVFIDRRQIVQGFKDGQINTVLFESQAVAFIVL